jgi:hypothetical protein
MAFLELVDVASDLIEFINLICDFGGEIIMSHNAVNVNGDTRTLPVILVSLVP